jgi:hypothetical protein
VDQKCEELLKSFDLNNPPPVPNLELGRDYQIVGVRLRLHGDPGELLAELSPKGNRIGLLLLGKILAEALSERDVIILSLAAAGELHNGAISLCVAGLSRTELLKVCLTTLKQSVAESLMTELALVGFYCTEEMTWRASPPNLAFEMESIPELARQDTEARERYRVRMSHIRGGGGKTDL